MRGALARRQRVTASRSQQLAHVPEILGPTGIQLQQYQIAGLDHWRSAGSADGAIDRALLPGGFPDDDVDRTLVGSADADHTRQRVVGVTATNLDVEWVVGQGSPEGRLKAAAVENKQVDVEC